MSLLDRIEDCRRWRPEAYRPFAIEDRVIGRVRHEMARRLADFPAVFQIGDDAVRLNPSLAEPDGRTEAVATVLRRLVEAGDIRRWRGEAYPVVRRWGETPLMLMDRGAVPDFGVRAFGVHMNGYVRKASGLHLWVGRRSKNKPTGPGKLDHLVAGGQPHGLSVRDNLVKECAEEAGIPRALAEQAVPVGLVSYITEQPEGLRNDIAFCYDLAVPEDFVPRNTDGEVEAFHLWPIEQVIEVLAAGDDFKFNVALVNIDFLVRRGILGPQDPDYVAIVAGLRLCQDRT